jgi:nucleoside 2-deoxyribosyltransferase
MNKVYLAGGFNTDWRDTVKTLKFKTWHPENLEFFDPKLKPDKHWFEYGTWDVHFIKQCDIVFAYMEKTNPSGYGLSAEMGYAKALNKTVIFVLESGHEKEKYLQFLKQFADVVYETLDEGIEYLSTF